MLIKTILNKIHRFKSFVYTNVCSSWEGDDLIIEIEIEPRKKSKDICSKCGETRTCYDHLDTRRYEFITIWGCKVYFIYTPRRIDCLNNGATVGKLPWVDGKHHITNTFRIFLASWAKKLSWKETSETFNVSWEHVFRSVKDVVDYGMKNRSLKDIFSIGIDEIKYKIGHKYLTLGPVEGLNNKAKVAIRKSYGFREYDVLKMALFHQLGELPEPELTHRFC
jgi:transposase